MGTALTALRTAVEALQQKLPDSVFGVDLSVPKEAVADAYNALNDHEKRIAALEAAVSKVP